MKLKNLLPIFFLAAAMFLAGAFCGYLIQYEEPAPVVQQPPEQNNPYADMAESLGSAEQYTYYAIDENKDGTVLRSVFYRGKKALPFLYIPSTADGYTVTAVTNELTVKGGSSKVKFGEGIERIDSAHYEKGITEVCLPSTLKVLGFHALDGARSSFTKMPGDGEEGKLVIPGANLEDCALEGVRATKFVIGEGCEQIGQAAFGTEVTEVWLPATVKRCYCFCYNYGAELETIPLPNAPVTLHYAGTPAQLAAIDFGCPLPEEVTVVYEE